MGQWAFLGNPQWENPENTVTWPQRYSNGHIVFLVCGMQYFECKRFYNLYHIKSKFQRLYFGWASACVNIVDIVYAFLVERPIRVHHLCKMYITLLWKYITAPHVKCHDGTWGTLGQRITGFNGTTGAHRDRCPYVPLSVLMCPNGQCDNIIVIGYHHQKQPFWIILGK